MPQLLQTEVAALVNAGLIVQPDVFWIPSNSVPYGYVISVNPVGGSVVAQWTYVQILVSLGPSTAASNVTVPSVTGLQQYAAHQAIGQAGLTWNVDLYAYSPSVAQSYVISQTPAAGSSVAPGTTCQITVSLGVQPVPVTVIVPPSPSSVNALLTEDVFFFNLENGTGVILLES